MAISRMQQPRQMYGLGSFVKKAVKKVTSPVTKAAKKLVPKEIAGIMRVAAPFLPPGYREAAYLLGTAKQTGRISPMDLALTLAPSANQYFAADKSQPFFQRKGFFAETFPRANAALFGAPEVTTRGSLDYSVPEVIRSPVQKGAVTGRLPGFGEARTVSEASTGLFGTGGKMFQFGSDQGNILDNIEAFRDQSKLGSLLLGDGDGGFSKSKVAGVGVGVLSLIQNANTPREAGIALSQSTGNSDDYDRGYELFSQLKPELFEVPKQFRMANGGIMRTDYARGTDDKGVVNPFQPKPQGPVLPDEDKPFKPKPLKPIKMAEFDLLEYQEEFERAFPDMKEKRGTDEYNEMLEDYFRGLASKDDNKGIMMAGMDRKERAMELAEMLAEEQFGQDFYDLDIRTQMKVYQIALDEIDSGGNAMGGKPNNRIDFALGTKPTPEESGLGGLPIEADMRYTGGFMPYGAKEKADDVPARLSKNEFVFTADAVRAAGGGSVNEGAKKMYQAMKQLEKKPEAKGMMA